MGREGITRNAAGAMRVAQGTTLFDGKQLNALDQDLIDTKGTGTVTFDENITELSVTAGQYLVLQSKRRFPYFSGKSQVVELTMDNFQLEPGLIKSVGYWSSNVVAPYEQNYDGFRLVSDGDANEIRLEVLRNGTVLYEVPIKDWFEGVQAEEYDWSKFTVLFFEFLWLGGADLNLWMALPNGFYKMAEIAHVGVNPGSFILSPNQPVRYEIRSTTGTGSLRYICSQVATEGSLDEAGKVVVSRNLTPVSADVVRDIYLCVGVRKKEGFLDNAFQIASASIVTTGSNDAGQLLLMRGGTLSAAPSWVDGPTGKYEQATSDGTITVTSPGRVLAAFPVSRFGASQDLESNFLSWLSAEIDGVAEEYYLCYEALTVNQNIGGVLQLKEY